MIEIFIFVTLFLIILSFSAFAFFHYIRSLSLQEPQDVVIVFRSIIAEIISIFLYVLCVRFVFVCVVHKVALANVLALQFLETSKIFFAEVLPKFTVLLRNQIVVSKIASGVLFGYLFVFLFVEILHLLNFVLELRGHLVDLG